MSVDSEGEEYIIKAFELIWPDPDSMKRFKPKAQKIIMPFLDYIHSGPIYARGTYQEKESLLLEKAAVEMNRKHSELITFAWIPGYPRTILPLVPQLLEEELPDLGRPVAEFWDVYKENDFALANFKETVNRAKTWALMRLDCTTAAFWDSETKNIAIHMCLGQPRKPN